MNIVADLCRNRHGRERPRRDSTIFNPCYVGVEIEVEDAYHMYDRDYNHWDTYEDGSLRGEGAGEFVFNCPKSGREIELALQELRDIYEEAPWDVGARCSTHVHIDMTDLHTHQVCWAMAAYYVYEHTLFGMVGRHRSLSNYCIPARKLGQYAKVLHNVARGKLPHRDNDRYAALNVAALCKFGTLEFRHRPSCTNPYDLVDWIKVGIDLKTWASRQILKENYIPDWLDSIDDNTIKLIFPNTYQHLIPNQQGYARFARLLATDLRILMEKKPATYKEMIIKEILKDNQYIHRQPNNPGWVNELVANMQGG